MPGSVVLINGSVITANANRPRAAAVAIRGGRIVAVGRDDEALAHRENAEVVDLRGRTAVPGFNDAHCHPMQVGLAASEVDASPASAPDLTTLVERLRERAAATEPGRWVPARGYDDTRLAERRHPTRHDLDRASEKHPILLTRACHHVAVANGRALLLAGITARTPDPAGGRIDRDHRGEPTGVLRESAVGLVESALPEPSVEELAAALKRAGGIYNSLGVTSVAEAGIRRSEELQAYQRFRETGGSLRAYLMVIADHALDHFAPAGVRTGFGDEMLKIGPAKIFLDGSVGGGTARMREPYLGEEENRGLWMREPEEMRDTLKRAHEAGWQLCAHAIGDAAIDLLLDVYEGIFSEHPRPDARPRIEHCEFVGDSAVFDRISGLGALPVPGTTFLREFLPMYEQSLGRERLRYANAMRSFADREIVAAASSDAPVVTPDPLAGIQTMISRPDREAISLEEAIRAYTLSGAYASFEEGVKGSLTPGKLGDVAVLGEDLNSVEPDGLTQVGVDLTVLDGEIVYSRQGSR
ncbi:amidohydrolase [Rubrobacter aplysinae]|uniref:amidohydrolase n=1 Tax=Rubrobacter aplysinae TaxID=909625 RepID=UPI00064C092A|nr:amidohydrolase [Rubrobacter aplysinae]